MKATRKAADQSGITLIELLAALVITAFVVLMASRIFLSGNRQFLLRSAESQRLEEFHRLKGYVQGVLRGYVRACTAGRLSIASARGGESGGGGHDAEAALRAHFPDLAKAEFRCLEAAPDRSGLMEWKDSYQPGLIEYRLMMGRKGSGPAGTVDTLSGSWIK